ncbi:MAG: PaaI family thioesterase [Sneathiella sp.]|nr:PaaI family thioesterase [Sneathiella sp.]
MPLMTGEELLEFQRREFPQTVDMGISVEELSDTHIVIGMKTTDRHLRPGGTVSGPTMMELADLTMYFLLLAQIGPVALAVTTNLSINFLRKPEPGSLRATGKLLKLGRSLAVGEISIFSGDMSEPVAHVTTTYSIPPKR